MGEHGRGILGASFPSRQALLLINVRMPEREGFSPGGEQPEPVEAKESAAGGAAAAEAREAKQTLAEREREIRERETERLNKYVTWRDRFCETLAQSDLGKENIAEIQKMFRYGVQPGASGERTVEFLVGDDVAVEGISPEIIAAVRLGRQKVVEIYAESNAALVKAIRETVHTEELKEI